MVVYLLSEELKVKPEQITLNQALTLDESRPNMGLLGTNGLFSSKKWWDSIDQGKMPLLFFSGVIQKAYVAGQDPSKYNNTIDVLLDDNSIKSIGIYVNKAEDAEFFKIGHNVEIVYALDELKPGATKLFGEQYLDIALEMAVSLKPVVENNFFKPKDLPTGMASYGQSVSSLAISMAQNDGSLEEINAALTKAVKGTHPEGQDPALGILIAWGNLTGIPLDVFLTQQEMTPKKAAEILSNTPPTTEAKTLQFVAAKVYLAFAKSGKEIPSWDAGIGQYRFKNTGEMTNAKHPSREFNRGSIPYGKFENSNLNPIKDIDSFISIEQGNMNKKLGAKIGLGRFPFERGSDGVKQAVQTVQDTLANASAVSDKIPAASVRGQYDLIHIYSEKTQSTVSLRVLPNGKYEFDTLIPEKSSKFK